MMVHQVLISSGGLCGFALCFETGGYTQLRLRYERTVAMIADEPFELRLSFREFSIDKQTPRCQQQCAGSGRRIRIIGRYFEIGVGRVRPSAGVAQFRGRDSRKRLAGSDFPLTLTPKKEPGEQANDQSNSHTPRDLLLVRLEPAPRFVKAGCL